MSISDAQFAAFLKDRGNRRVILCTIPYVYQVGTEDSGDTEAHSEVGLLSFSDYPYRDRNTDQNDNRHFEARIAAVPQFSLAIDLDSLGGKTTTTIGEMILQNDDGRLDFLTDLIVDGWECRFYVGAPDWARSDFRQILLSIIQKITAPNENTISVALGDYGSIYLNQSIVGNAVGGSGPNAAQPLPLIMGYVQNVGGVLEDSASLLYGISAVEATVPAVYDSGKALTVNDPLLSAIGTDFVVDTGADTITNVNLLLAVDDIVVFSTTATMGLISGQSYWVIGTNYDIVAGTYSVSLTRGGSAVDLTDQFDPVETVSVSRFPAITDAGPPTTVTLAHAPAGSVTFDVSCPTLTDSRASDLLQALSGFTTASSSFAMLPSYTEDDDSCDFHLGLAVTERSNLIDVMNDVANSANAFWGFDQNGKMILGRILPQYIDSLDSVLSIVRDDIIGGVEAITRDKLPLTYKDARGYFQKSWTQQTDGFVSGTPLDRIAYIQNGGLFASAEPPSGALYTSDPSKYHRTMIQSPDYVTLLSQATCDDAYAEFQTWLEDKREQVLPHMQLMKLPLSLAAYQTRLGDVVDLTLDRFGLEDGAKFEVVAIDFDLTAAVITFTILNRKPAAYDFVDVYAATFGGAEPGIPGSG